MPYNMHAPCWESLMLTSHRRFLKILLLHVLLSLHDSETQYKRPVPRIAPDLATHWFFVRWCDSVQELQFETRNVKNVRYESSNFHIVSGLVSAAA